MKRCQWSGKDPLMINYHDKEWGVPIYDDNRRNSDRLPAYPRVPL